MAGQSPRRIFFAAAGIVVRAWPLGRLLAPRQFASRAQSRAAVDSGYRYRSRTTRRADLLRCAGHRAALNTVAIRAQVTGQIISINFRQGQEVKQGDVLAKIDPAPFKAALDQAVSKKERG